MPQKGSFGIVPLFGAALLVTIPLAAATPASVPGHVMAGNTPAFVANAKPVGLVDSAQTIDVTIWLNPHNRGELDHFAEELYDRNSPNYHRWLSKAEFSARFAPTREEAEMVRAFFAAHGLQIVRTGPDNMFVRARGSVENVQRAFRVQLKKYQVAGKIVRANATEPSIEGPIAALVQSVAGLNNLEYQHPYRQRALKAASRGGLLNHSLAADESSEKFFTNACFNGRTVQTFSDSSTLALYAGNSYVRDPNVPGCGYSPQDIWSAYNLNGLYKAGYDGTGQTIVIIDWCGSPTIRQDANAFSARYGLPPLTESNFSIINYPGPSTCSAPDPEINIDVEWAHAIAPGANIALVVPPSASFQDVNEAQFYAENYGLGNVISGSYGSEELNMPKNVLETEDLLNEIASVLGISANFATADDGDFTFDAGLPPSVAAPASSPHATGVGGVTLALNNAGGIAFQTGWGNNVTILENQGQILNPPFSDGFYGGSGGGPSDFFAKPFFQSRLPGKTRQLPDISWLADPYTGGVIAITQPGTYPGLTWEVYGGTSMACPMFSALWAIANQEAGEPLGQAAAYLYSMPSRSITDVHAVSSKTNVRGLIFDLTSSKMTTYSPAQLAAPLENTVDFYSALWTPPYSGATVVLTFGTDSGLKVTNGWDNVTGLGTPNGKVFADYFNPAATTP
jgi:subtilase family serine protease